VLVVKHKLPTAVLAFMVLLSVVGKAVLFGSFLSCGRGSPDKWAFFFLFGHF
jgi:hypothetical protein